MGERRDGEGKVHDSAKGVAPLKLNLQLVSDKSVSSVAVVRAGWTFGGQIDTPVLGTSESYFTPTTT